MVQSVPSGAILVTSCWVRPKELVKIIRQAPLASGLEMIQCVNVSSISHVSKIQLVVYYQCCVLIGSANTRLYVIAH